MPASNDDTPAGGFLTRWSRRKLQSKDAAAPPPVGATATASPLPSAVDSAAPVSNAHASAAARAEEPARPPQIRPGESAPIQPTQPTAPAPTLDELQALDHSADLRRFVASGVDEGVRRAALHKIFQAPQFKVMDGLDTYIDDYNVASPMPASMLERLRQSAATGLFAQPDAPMADAADAQMLPPPTVRVVSETAASCAPQAGAVALASQEPQRSPCATVMTPAAPMSTHPGQPDAPSETSEP